MMIRTRNPYFRLVDDLLNDARPWLASGGPSEARGFGLALDVEENADAYIVRANLPGISQDDISVNIHEDVLSISAETAAENREENQQGVAFASGASAASAAACASPPRWMATRWKPATTMASSASLCRKPITSSRARSRSPSTPRRARPIRVKSLVGAACQPDRSPRSQRSM